MTNLLLIAVGLTFAGVSIDYLRNRFACEHPEFLPFLNGVRWFILIGGSIVLIGVLLSILANKIGP